MSRCGARIIVAFSPPPAKEKLFVLLSESVRLVSEVVAMEGRAASASSEDWGGAGPTRPPMKMLGINVDVSPNCSFIASYFLSPAVRKNIDGS